MDGVLLLLVGQELRIVAWVRPVAEPATVQPHHAFDRRWSLAGVASAARSANFGDAGDGFQRGQPRLDKRLRLSTNPPGLACPCDSHLNPEERFFSELTYLGGSTRVKQIVSKFEYASSGVLASVAPRHPKNQHGERANPRRDPPPVSNNEPGSWKNETGSLTIP